MGTFVHQLVVQFGIGIAVLVRCFVDRKAVEHQITERLGDGFSRPPFASVVVYLLDSLLAELSLSVCAHASVLSPFTFKRLFCSVIRMVDLPNFSKKY